MIDTVKILEPNITVSICDPIRKELEKEMATHSSILA